MREWNLRFSIAGARVGEGGEFGGGGSSWLMARYVIILDPLRIYGHILFNKMCVSLRHSLYVNYFLSITCV